MWSSVRKTSSILHSRSEGEIFSDREKEKEKSWIILGSPEESPQIHLGELQLTFLLNIFEPVHQNKKKKDGTCTVIFLT